MKVSSNCTFKTFVIDKLVDIHDKETITPEIAEEE